MTKKKGKYKAEDLYEFCEEQTTVDCSNCMNSDSEMGEASFAVEDFFKKGWRATKQGNVYCPECAKKKLKS